MSVSSRVFLRVCFVFGGDLYERVVSLLGIEFSIVGFYVSRFRVSLLYVLEWLGRFFVFGVFGK